ncbi:MAG TPA: hypothetical protein VK137_05945 [Planctomycetaceae bacterium]|nr:hypothetical protein [Planctomycetaceae bacterium]
MNARRVFADFHNADRSGRLRLNCVGTIEDLARLKIELCAGLELTLYSEDVEADGRVEFSDDEKLWVAAIDWNAVRSAMSPSQATVVA